MGSVVWDVVAGAVMGRILEKGLSRARLGLGGSVGA